MPQLSDSYMQVKTVFAEKFADERWSITRSLDNLEELFFPIDDRSIERV